MYLHRRGSQFSTQPFIKPTRDRFMFWVDDFIKENPDLKYDVYLTGAFCHNLFEAPGSEINTLDVDVVLFGPTTDLINLKMGLRSGFELGIKHNLLVDIAWRSVMLTSEFKKGDSQEKIITYLDVEQIYPSGEGRVYTMQGTVVQLIDGLYRLSNYDLSPAIEKFKSRNYSIPFKKIV